MDYSIVIPASNRLEHLKQCIESIVKTTDLSDKEIIIASNGCTDGTIEYVKSLGDPFKIIHWPKRLGYARAANMGFNVASGRYIIRIDSDIVFLNNNWFDLLKAPFDKFSNAGISAPGVGTSYGYTWPVFFCAMFKRELLYKIGYLDPIYDGGSGEDTDFGIRAVKAGYTIHKVPLSVNGEDTDGQFPIYHAPSSSREQMSFDRQMCTLYCDTILKQRYGKINIV